MDDTIYLLVVTDSGVDQIDVETLPSGTVLPSSFIRLETGGETDHLLVVWGNLDDESPAYDNVGIEFHAADIFLIAGSLADAVLATPLKNGCYDEGQVSAALLHMPSDFLEAGIGVPSIQT